MNRREFDAAVQALVGKVANEKYKKGFLDGVYMVSAYGIEETKRLLNEDKRDLHEIAEEARALVKARGQWHE